MSVHLSANICLQLEPDYAKEDILMETVRWLKPGHKALIFCETWKKCDVICKEFRGSTFRAQSIHNGYVWWQRKHHAGQFRDGHIDVLLGTPSTFISLDLGQVDLVIDYDGKKAQEDPLRRIKEGILFTHLAKTGKFVALTDE